MVRLLLLCLLVLTAPARTATPEAVPILVYHRFAATAADSMTITTASLDWQFAYLKRAGYTPIPLEQALAWHRGEAVVLPDKPVVLTADDGHRSVWSELRPRIQRERWPVTLFIYPSAISNAEYAMSWEQLAALKATGLFALQSHTFWHPNFHQDRRRMAPAEYARAVDWQLGHARTVLEKRLGGPVDLLAWPFGIVDEGLMARADALGYRAGLALGGKPARRTDPALALPRILIAEANALALPRLLEAGP